MNIGFFGGSFDPIHFGHLIAAQDALERFGLDRVVFVPAAQAPLKDAVSTSPEDRLAMVKAAVEPRFSVSDFEIRKGGVNYTIDTVTHFRATYPDDRLYWIVGADQVAQLHRWREIARVAALVEFIFVERPGFPDQLQQVIPGLRLHRCDGHLVELSSTELRERVRANLPLDYFVPDKAIVTIREKGLYRGNNV